jgi:hypothetical protein
MNNLLFPSSNHILNPFIMLEVVVLFMHSSYLIWNHVIKSCFELSTTSFHCTCTNCYHLISHMASNLLLYNPLILLLALLPLYEVVKASDFKFFYGTMVLLLLLVYGTIFICGLGSDLLLYKLSLRIPAVPSFSWAGDFLLSPTNEITWINAHHTSQVTSSRPQATTLYQFHLRGPNSGPGLVLGVETRPGAPPAAFQSAPTTTT